MQEITGKRTDKTQTSSDQIYQSTKIIKAQFSKVQNFGREILINSDRTVQEFTLNKLKEMQLQIEENTKKFNVFVENFEKKMVTLNNMPENSEAASLPKQVSNTNIRKERLKRLNVTESNVGVLSDLFNSAKTESQMMWCESQIRKIEKNMQGILTPKSEEETDQYNRLHQNLKEMVEGLDSRIENFSPAQEVTLLFDVEMMDGDTFALRGLPSGKNAGGIFTWTQPDEMQPFAKFDQNKWHAPVDSNNSISTCEIKRNFTPVGDNRLTFWDAPPSPGVIVFNRAPQALPEANGSFKLCSETCNLEGLPVFIVKIDENGQQFSSDSMEIVGKNDKMNLGKITFSEVSDTIRMNFYISSEIDVIEKLLNSAGCCEQVEWCKLQIKQLKNTIDRASENRKFALNRDTELKMENLVQDASDLLNNAPKAIFLNFKGKNIDASDEFLIRGSGKNTCFTFTYPDPKQPFDVYDLNNWKVEMNWQNSSPTNVVDDDSKFQIPLYSSVDGAIEFKICKVDKNGDVFWAVGENIKLSLKSGNSIDLGEIAFDEAPEQK